MLLSDIESAVRLDLFDPAGADQRWSNADLDRAIDRAVALYTQYAPNIVYADVQARPRQRTYPYPASWNANYPVLWLERVLYPLQVYGSACDAPASAATLALAAGAGLGIGVYRYAVSYVTEGGETPAGPVAQVTTTSGNQTVNLSNIPLGPASGNSVIGRNLYRSTVNGSTLTLLATLADNVTTTYADSASDASIAAAPQPPSLNTSGVMLWPPRERAFTEYRGLHDSASTFTLTISDAELPEDSSVLMRVFYATRHQLDAQSSTIPEIHRDIITLGACAYAMEAYQAPTNDNFAFQNGGVYDRLDDTAIPGAWLRAAQNRMQQFQARLEEIKRQRAQVASALAHWGPLPPQWWRV